MDGGKIAHPPTGNRQADPKKQKLGKSREERLNMFLASFKDPFGVFEKGDRDIDLSGPHNMTMREFASMQLDDIEHGNFDLEVDYSNIDDVSAVSRYYDPEANLMVAEDILSELMDCSRLAIDEYNKSNGSHFDVVSVIKANVEVVAPIRYYITFKAFDKTQNIGQSFQAMVDLRIPITVIVVRLVRIRKPLEPYSP